MATVDRSRSVDVGPGAAGGVPPRGGGHHRARTIFRGGELHDSFTTGEILAYEALGLTPKGTAERFVVDAANTYSGQVVINPSGGMPAKGHPLGATGVAQCAELVWQLRGQAGARQVDYANPALSAMSASAARR